jgi:hypothetical protein
MPIQKKTIQKKYNAKKLTKRNYKKMLNIFATPSQPGYKYLYCFDESDWEYIANHLKASPTVHEVTNFALLNTFTIAKHKVRPIRLDEIEMFDLEAGYSEWENTIEMGWLEVKHFLRFAAMNYDDYRFL